MSAALILAAGILLRNPFWPIGYEGEREEISADSHVEAKAAPKPKDETQTAKAKAQQEEEEKLRKAKERAATINWAAAQKTLRIGGTVFAKEPDGSTRSSVFINGRDYVDGDLVSVNCGEHRFTWRVTGLTENRTLKLERVRARPLENSRPKGAKK
ncbi:MAG: hypothetical protein IKE55_04940 [Kiritimatiellae bacterium]|nr:hypothetical protein [Kiritimatiellia bacterium]